jgi:NADH pyrophosphatase NudC (nudix superfamily)
MSQSKKKPIVIVAGIVRNGNKLLCIKQDKGTYKDFVWLPAGHLKANETLEEAVIREVKEETGLDVKVNKLLMKVECNPLLFYFYFCDIVSGRINPKGEIKEVFWLTFDEILKLKKVHPLLCLIASLSIHKPEFYEGLTSNNLFKRNSTKNLNLKSNVSER